MTPDIQAPPIAPGEIDLKAIPSAEAADLSISIVGLGYVGAVSAACFTDLWRRVIGVDTDAAKLERIANGRSPIVEAELDTLLGEAVALDLLSTSENLEQAVVDTDVTFVCVGTPSAPNGGCDLTYLRAAMETIGAGLKRKQSRHVVAIRSTIPPGTTREPLIPLLEAASGKTEGVEFGVVFHPEFLREGVAVADFRAPPKTVIGGDCVWAAETVAALYAGVDDAPILSSLEAAEMVKYVDNNWHAAKVCFANEIGKICRSVGVDSHEVMDVFAQDTKLNISSYYMRPGFAFGGSCLPKDVRGMTHLARDRSVDTPLLNALLPSNEAQLAHALALIERTGAKRLGVLGVAFKAGTDDLRESPVLTLLGALLGRDDLSIRTYDPNISVDAGLRHYAQHAAAGGALSAAEALPALMTTDLDGLLDWADALIVSHRTPVFRAVVQNRRSDQHCIDLIRLFDAPEQSPTYHGVCW